MDAPLFPQSGALNPGKTAPSGPPQAAIVGSGPAALMAADRLSAAGVLVRVYEKRRSIARKLLVAGSSGLNITNSLPLAKFASHYSPQGWIWEALLNQFGPQQWIDFIENELKIGTFEGTSGRYFVEEMKAAVLVKKWTQRLQAQGVQFHWDHELIGFESSGQDVRLRLRASEGTTIEARSDIALLALGGGSWEPQEVPLRWLSIFESLGIGFLPFRSSNAGYSVDWNPKFLEEAEGKPLKNIVLSTAKGSRKGELMVTRYGLEGTPIYQLGTPGKAALNLKPDLTPEALLSRLRSVKENLAPIRRAKKLLGLCEASQALLFHHAPPETRSNLEAFARMIQNFEIFLGDPRPLAEAISASGGVRLDEVSRDLELNKHPGIYLAGEMLDWDVCTGGFLIQACVSQGHWVADAMLRRLKTAAHLR